MTDNETERPVEVIYLRGCIQKDGETFTDAEVEAFADDFLSWLEAHKLGFGGTYGGIHDEEEYARLTTLEDAKAALAVTVKALREIRGLNPAETSDGFNEWGEAACFRTAQRSAEDALADPLVARFEADATQPVTGEGSEA